MSRQLVILAFITTTARAGFVAQPDHRCNGIHVPNEALATELPAGDVAISAGSATAQYNESITLDDSVTARYSQWYLTAESATLLGPLKAPQTLIVRPPLTLYSELAELSASGLTLDLGREAYWANELSGIYYPRQAYLQADDAYYAASEGLTLTNAHYTTCRGDTPLWSLMTHRLHINPDTGRAVARDSSLKINDHRAFYWPYLDFPVDGKRHSGFLFPSIGGTQSGGLAIGWPYYFNWAPNYDGVLTPTLFSRRGLGLTQTVRYLTKTQKGELNGTVLPNDWQFGRLIRAARENPPFASTDPRQRALTKASKTRGVVAWRHELSSGIHHGDVDITAVSDSEYYKDFSDDLIGMSQVNLPQMMQYAHWYSNGFQALRWQRYQALHPEKGPINTPPYERRPEWVFKLYDVSQPLGSHAQLLLRGHGEWTYFTVPHEPLTGKTQTKGQRFMLEPTVALPLTGRHWWLTPQVKSHIRHYNNQLGADDLTQLDAHPSYVIPEYRVEGGVTLNWVQGDWDFEWAPKASYIDIPFHDQSRTPIFDSQWALVDGAALFASNRFSGGDRIGDTRQLGYALSFFGFNGDKTIEAQLGRVSYLKDRRVLLDARQLTPALSQQELLENTRPHSDWIGHLTYSEPDRVFDSHFQYDGTRGKLNEFSLRLLQPGWQDLTWQFNYDFVRRNWLTNQTSFDDAQQQIGTGIFWPLTLRFSTMGQIQYDLANARMLEWLGGIEYDSCCVKWQLVGSRYLRPNSFKRNEYQHGVFLQVELKGFASMGPSRLSQYFNKSYLSLE